MAQYIDKDALVAKIENLENTYKECPTRNSYEEGLKNGRLIGYKDALYKIDTLEMKEVDLDEEIEKCLKQHSMLAVGKKGFTNIAKHFFDIGYFNGHIHDGDRIEHVDGRRVNVSRLQRIAKPIEEPVSDDLEEAMQHDAPDNIGIDDLLYWRNGFIAGVKWKEELFEKNRIAACDKQTEEEAEREYDFVMGIIENEHRQPTFGDAIKYGMKKMKEQMMAKAIDGEVGYWNLRGLSVNVKLPRSVKEGDKVKVLVVKED